MHGVSTRKVNDLVRALGSDAGVSKSKVSRICAELDEHVCAFRDRPLDHSPFPYGGPRWRRRRACFPRRSKRACTPLGAVMGLALGMVVSVTTDVPLAPEAGLLLGALVGRFSRQGA